MKGAGSWASFLVLDDLYSGTDGIVTFSDAEY